MHSRIYITLAAIVGLLFVTQVAYAQESNIVTKACKNTYEPDRITLKSLGGNPGRNICKYHPTLTAVDKSDRILESDIVWLTPPPPAAVVVNVPSDTIVSAAPTQTVAAPATSSNGFCGAYQFLPSTWSSIGMPGSPCGASPQMQDQAALKLYRQQGTSPWPNCGHFMPDLAAVRQCENSGSYAP